MFDGIMEAFLSTWSLGGAITYGCFLIACAGLMEANKHGRPNADTSEEHMEIGAVVVGVIGILAILSSYASWVFATPNHLNHPTCEEMLVLAHLRLIWSIATIAATAATITVGRCLADDEWLEASRGGSVLVGLHRSIVDRLKLRHTLRSLRGIEWDQTRRNIRTVVTEFLPGLRSRRKELIAQIDRMERNLKTMQDRSHAMNDAVRSLYDRACGVRKTLDARLADVNGKIRDCEDYVELSATLAGMSPTTLTDIAVPFDQLAEAVNKTCNDVEQVRAELEAPNVRRLDTRQRT